MLEHIWQHRASFWVILGSLLVLGLCVHWMAWVFRFGRFRSTPATQATQQLRYVAASFFVEIINDFRHFLALVIVLLFAAALFLAMYPGLRARDIALISDGVQVVAAALGGLIGSIIGYYFGESAATRREASSQAQIRDTAPPIQGAPPADDAAVPGIVPAPPPPGT